MMAMIRILEYPIKIINTTIHFITPILSIMHDLLHHHASSSINPSLIFALHTMDDYHIEQ